MIEVSKFDKIIAANWKLNGSLDFINRYFNDFHSKTSFYSNVCGIICPPSIYLNNFSINHPLFLGAQDCSKFNSGAYTGEISALMLKESNCQFCIVGHSERRQIFNQTDEDIKLKAENLINQSINPIICIGETFEEKKRGSTKDVLKKQIFNSLPENASIQSIIIAYEPIWAIGSGLMPTLAEIDSIHSFIKNIKNLEKFKILYGGSVKSNNAKNIMDLENVDGVLVGGASLDPSEFIKILNS
jgi:triosephosphate isomerase